MYCTCTSSDLPTDPANALELKAWADVSPWLAFLLFLSSRPSSASAQNPSAVEHLAGCRSRHRPIPKGPATYCNDSPRLPLPRRHPLARPRGRRREASGTCETAPVAIPPCSVGQNAVHRGVLADGVSARRTALNSETTRSTQNGPSHRHPKLSQPSPSAPSP